MSSITGDPRDARVGALLRWPMALTVVAARHLWGRTPVRRSDEGGDAGDAPPPLPAGETDPRIQLAADGRGTLLHRRYTVRICGSPQTAAQLMTVLMADPNRWSPEFAVFRRTAGAAGRIREGDEFLIRMPGPWDGPVKVVTADECGFRLATLRGHLEAGLIDFRVTDHAGGLDFVIESWARPGDQVSHLLYNRVPVAKEIQLVMWTHACRRAAELSGGQFPDGVWVHTRALET